MPALSIVLLWLFYDNVCENCKGALSEFLGTLFYTSQVHLSFGKLGREGTHTFARDRKCLFGHKQSSERP